MLKEKNPMAATWISRVELGAIRNAPRSKKKSVDFPPIPNAVSPQVLERCTSGK
jgi:hypothetical protein